MTHTSSTVFAFCALVGIQVTVGIVYRLAGDGGYKFSPALSLMLSETIKLVIAIATLLYQRAHLPALFHSHMHLAPVAVGLALLYAFNNLAAFQLFRMSDPATISVSKSVASIVVAAITYVIFGKKYAYPQWICLALQVVGLSIIHLNVSSSLPSSSSSVSNNELVIPLLVIQVTISGSCGVWNSHTLKPKEVNLNAFNIFLYGFGALINSSAYFMYEGASRSIFEGWSFASAGILLCNSLIGLAISAIYKYSGAITRTWATAIATCVLYFLVMVFKWATFPTVPIIQGIVIVFGCAYLYQEFGKLSKVEKDSNATGSTFSVRLLHVFLVCFALFCIFLFVRLKFTP